MPSLLETFCVAGGQILNVPYHAARVEWSLGCSFPMALMLDALRAQAAQQKATSGKWRATVTYSRAGVEGIRMIPYQVPAIAQLQLVVISENFYAKKWADRSRLNAYKAVLPPGVEPLFILDGQPSDTTFTNIVLERNGQLFTPAAPLLRGTKRHRLIDKGMVEMASIFLGDLQRYDAVHLINAMLDLGEVVIPMERVNQGSISSPYA